ncbi:hypothetical protein AWB85_21815 [Mycobacteroides immunogenum]|uniref:Uncharacterized protein n=1 Tax=Mycobacteroides immunogenum TaxID=83262 RepID=A0A179VEF5_9MYCO|nr:hypothetical protein AWB85_21815 [Mycobacteroides immunogenum]
MVRCTIGGRLKRPDRLEIPSADLCSQPASIRIRRVVVMSRSQQHASLARRVFPTAMLRPVDPSQWRAIAATMARKRLAPTLKRARAARPSGVAAQAVTRLSQRTRDTMGTLAGTGAWSRIQAVSEPR